MRFNNFLGLARRFTISRIRICGPPFLVYTNSIKRSPIRSGSVRHVSTNSSKVLATTPNNEVVETNELTELDFDLVENYSDTDEGAARDILFKDSTDPLIGQISNCVSLEQLFSVYDQNHNSFNSDHVVQTILVLFDLSNIYHNLNRVNGNSSSSKQFLKQLNENRTFLRLLANIKSRVNVFTKDHLSYVSLYLIKLGFEVDYPLMQSLLGQLEDQLLEDFDLGSASRYLECAFNQSSLRSYYMAQNLVPLVLDQIDSCPVDQFGDLTVALNSIHKFVTDEPLVKYTQRVNDLINNGSITCSDHTLILKIVLFLNYPKWRDKNTALISKCVSLIKSNIHLMSVSELLRLYDVFFKIQEPGDVLSLLQRASSKYLQQFDDVITAEKIELLSSLVYFSPPSLRRNFQELLKTYVKNCNDFDNLFLLRKVLHSVKISDRNLCRLYWTKVLRCVQSDLENLDIIKICHGYIGFNNDVDNFRHLDFEHEILNVMRTYANRPLYQFFPHQMSSILCFVLSFGRMDSFLESLVRKLESNWQQLTYLDCARLSQSLKKVKEADNSFLKLPLVKRINIVLDKSVEMLSRSDESVWRNTILLRSTIVRDKNNSVRLNRMLSNLTESEQISSKTLESIAFCLLSTSACVPKVLDQLVDYVVTCKENILAFNIERVLYLCYYLNYYPKTDKSSQFFETAANIIIRDQERMSGLSIIHCGLSLCFFNKLPNSMIKSIFNTEFLDKVDLELQNCYSKEKYPQRVRHNLMQLNRAVCLDYPESNIPWFHQKYVEEINRTGVGRKNKLFPSRVKEYLSKVVNEDMIKSNVTTPYGYTLDFVLDLDSQGKVTAKDSENNERVGFLLMPQYAYTQFVVHPKGRHQLKKRHLEMLGYRVIHIQFSDWINLYYSEERINFLTNLIWPEVQTLR